MQLAAIKRINNNNALAENSQCIIVNKLQKLLNKVFKYVIINKKILLRSVITFD